MVASTTRNRIQSCFNDVGFPATTNDMVRSAERNQCDAETARALRGIFAETYNNLDQTCVSVTIVSGPQTKPGRAESAMDIGSQSLLVEEAGETSFPGPPLASPSRASRVSA